MSTTLAAQHLVQESGGFAPTGQFHLSTEKLGEALCGQQPRHGVHWNVAGERSAFEAAGVQDRICKRCLKRKS